MAILEQGRRWTDFLGAEANGKRSRENIIVGNSQTIIPGTVLGKVANGAASAGAVTGTGNGAMGAITLGQNAKAGTYRLRITAAAANAGAFEVTDPDGDVVGTGNVASAFTSSHLNFTLADGSTDFGAGATIPITVAVGSGVYKILAPAALDGSEDAVAIALYPATTTGSTTAAISAVVRDCEVNAGELTWPDEITDGEKAAATAQLAAQGIILRTGV